MTPATEVQIVLGTDVPMDRGMTVTAIVAAEGNAASMRRTWTRAAGGSNAIEFPASFAVVPGASARDAAVTLTIQTHVDAGSDGTPPLDFSRVARFRFTPHTTNVVPIFLPVACGASVASCQSNTGGACTLSEYCAMQGRTCGNDGTCTTVDVTPVPSIPADAALPSYFDAAPASDGIDATDDVTQPSCPTATSGWKTTATTGAPLPRSVVTAVWDGHDVLFWGGLEGTTYVSTGARFDPATNTWSGMSATGAPSSRVAYSLTWAGRYLVVWGGRQNLTPLADGAVYDPASDTWHAMSTVGAPSPRFYHSAVWTGRELIVWGGFDSLAAPSSSLADGASYDPASDTWSPLGLVGAPRSRGTHFAFWTGTRMLVWGGTFQDSSGATNLTDGALYDPVTRTWTPMQTAGAPLSRVNACMVWTGHEMIVWGGLVDSQRTDATMNYGYSNTGGRYDPIADAWRATTTTGAPEGRLGAGCVWSGAEMIAWGGMLNAAAHPDGGFAGSGGRYDPIGDRWTDVPTGGQPSPRVFDATPGGAVWTGCSMVVWGDSADNTGGIYIP